MLTSVCLYASQLASCIGFNRFKKPSDALELVWHRVSPASFAEARQRNNIKTKDEAVQDIISANEAVRHLLIHAEDLTGEASTSGDVARGYQAVSRELATTADLNMEELKLIDDAMKKNLYTSFGTKQENVALQHIQPHIPCVPDDTFYKRWIADVDGIPIYIAGKIDALGTDGGTIVEIKNRINRLFYDIPMHERIQVMAYLFAVPQASTAVLVECLTRDDGTVLAHSVPIEWDEDFWEDVVLPRVRNFVRYLFRLLRDPAEQDAYLKTSRRAAVVMKELASS